MSPAVIILPASLFILCLFVHAALWRIRIPKSRPLALFVIFVILPLAAGGALQRLCAAASPFGALTNSELLAAFLLQAAFASAYILTYPAFEALSPSLVIVLLAGAKGGISKGELAGYFSDEALFEPRMRDLVESGLARKKGALIAATFKGRLLACFFMLMRAFLGLSKGGG